MQYCSVEVGRGWLISKIKILVQELGGQRREGLIIGRIRRMWHVHVCHRVSEIVCLCVYMLPQNLLCLHLVLYDVFRVFDMSLSLKMLCIKAIHH